MSENLKPVFQVQTDAQIRANLRGTEKAVLIFGGIFTSIFLGSIASVSFAGVNAGNICGLFFGSAGISVLFIDWVRSRPKHQPELIQTAVARSESSLTVTTSVTDTEQVLLLIREVGQSRLPLPAPDGEIFRGSSPRTTGAIREYSPDEKKKFTDELIEKIKLHDQEIISKLQISDETTTLQIPAQTDYPIQTPISKTEHPEQ